MHIFKRNGDRVEVCFDEITSRNKNLSSDLEIDTSSLSQSVIMGLRPGMSTRELDELSSESAIFKSTHEPDYAILASRIAWNDLHKITKQSFTDVIDILKNNMNKINNTPNPLIGDEVYLFSLKHKDQIESTFNYKRDYDYSYPSYRTMIQSYLQKVDDEVVERPQHLLMRVALGIHGPSTANGITDEGNIEEALETYKQMSLKKFTHATPTLFNAGTVRPQLSSCFLLTCPDDLIGITDCWKHCAIISKYAGGIGVDVTSRSKGSYIAGTNGHSEGIVPLLRVFNNIARYANQSGKRKGAFSFYIQPWHPDIFEFLEIRLNTGKDEERARDIFTALWIPDLFFKRLLKNETWSLFCPGSFPELIKLYGKEFEARYIELEKDKKYTKQVPAEEIWKKICKSLEETGLPYMLSKDHVNRKSNQMNIGPITGSNLCVHGDTMILTDLGQYPINELENKQVNVWNGEEFSETTVKKTGSQVKLVEITFSNGESLKCTPEHEFYIMESYSKSSIKKIKANELEIKMKLIKYDLPSIDGNENENLKYAYTAGFLTGDGTYDTKRNGDKVPKIELYGEKQKLIPYLNIINQGEYIPKKDSLTVYVPLDIAPKFTVPINAETSNKLKWLAGLCDSDGTVAKNGTNLSIQISSIEKEFLLKVRLMLQTMGIDSKVTMSQRERERMMPDGRGGQKLYTCQDLWRLLISSSELKYLITIGFECHRLKLDDFEVPQRGANHFVTVTSIDLDTDIIADTYCFTEQKRNMGMFNGILTGQCVEIMQYHAPESVAVCNLASVALPMFIKDGKYDFVELGRIVEIIINNMNKIIDKNFYPIDETRTNNLAYRPVGLGVQGLADVFAMFELPWESEDAKILNQVIFEVMYFHAMKKSAELARKDGAYSAFEGSPVSKGILQYDMQVKWDDEIEDFVSNPIIPLTQENNKSEYESFTIPNLNWSLLKKVCKKGIRNSLLIAPMPTQTTSQILGNNDCFSGDTPVTLASGLNIKIKDIRPGDMVSTYSEKLKGMVSAQVTDFLPKGIKDVVCLTFEDGRKLTCTPEHKFLMANGEWCQAKDIKINEDEVMSALSGTPDIIGNDEGIKSLHFNKVTSAKEFIDQVGAKNWFASEDSYKKDKMFTYAVPLDAVALPTMKLKLIDRRPAGSIEVFDINVAEHHNFVANGIVVHNCFEPYTSNLYTKKVISGDLPVVNQHLYQALKKIGMWNKDIVDEIIKHNGSIQNIPDIPKKIKDVFKTVWEIPQRIIVAMAASRGAFIDQSQSMNIYLERPTLAKLSSLYIDGWKKGNKTLSYYLRSKPSVGAVKFSIMQESNIIDPSLIEKEKKYICTDDICTSCQ